MTPTKIIKIWLFALAPLLLFTACKKKLTQFEIDYTSEVVIQSTFGQAIPFSVYTPQITTNSEAEFEINNTNKEKINSIFLRDLVLTITSPSNETFSFLNSIDLFISSPNHAEQKVAFKQDVPTSQGAVLVCDIVEVDLQAFIKDTKFTLRVETVTDETLPQDVVIDVYTNFFVDAQLLK